MRSLWSMVETVASTTATVLLRGESGAGKDVVARAIHGASSRRLQPFVRVNCAALPGELLESELFGYEKGAFTGAFARKPGQFELAEGGSILLDEIGEVPAGLQAKLLHVLQDLEFSRIGGRTRIRADVRVIASTNRDLEQMMRSGLFREDLFYRLNVIEIRVPPLRARRGEIPVLARHFLGLFNREYDRAAPFSDELMALFEEYSWPGNVRELENMVRRLVVLGDLATVEGEMRTRLRLAGYPGGAAEPASSVASSVAPEPARRPTPEPPRRGADITPALGLREIARRAALAAEREALKEVLDRVKWNRMAAARLLKVSYKTLLKKIGECGLAGEPDETQAS
jgi:two-component system response regulator AtoC